MGSKETDFGMRRFTISERKKIAFLCAFESRQRRVDGGGFVVSGLSLLCVLRGWIVFNEASE